MPSHLIIMMVERNELLITGALRFSMVDCKISQLLALPTHWVKPCLAQLVSALALAWTLLHQHLGHQFSNSIWIFLHQHLGHKAALPSVQLPCTPFFTNPCPRHWRNYHHEQQQHQHGGTLTWHCHHITGIEFSHSVSHKPLPQAGPVQ